MITLPIWLLIIISVFGLPFLLVLIGYLIMCVKVIIATFKLIVNEFK